MKAFSIIAAGLGLVTMAVPTVASAQGWQTINQRQANLERRINQDVRSGALNRTEATRLRTQFRDLRQLEARYQRSNGLSAAERRDLDRRFDALSARTRVQKNDHQGRRY